jgi:hypothetical protein
MSIPDYSTLLASLLKQDALTELTVREMVQQLVNIAQDNPVVAVGALIGVLFLTSLLPTSRRTRRTRTYGGRPLSYHLGRALGNMWRGGSRRR